MGEKAVSSRVLVIGDDMRIFLTVVRSLGRAGKEIHVAPFNWHSPALKSRYIAKVHYLPRGSDNADGWFTAVRDLTRQYAFDLIVPCCDRAILPLSANSGRIGVPIAVPPPDAMDLLFDKELTRGLCHELGIPVAEGVRLDGGATPAGLVARFGLPLVIKPRRSYSMDRLHGSDKVLIPETDEELRNALRSVREPSRYLVERYFEGTGIGLSVLAQGGTILQAFQHRRLRQGRGGCSSYRASEPVNPDLMKACEKVCRHTNLTGVCMFEFRFNLESSDWILVETNARFWGSLPLPVSLGVDFPAHLYDLLVHGVSHPPVEYAAGVTSRNLLLDGANLLASAPPLRSGKLGVWLSDLGGFAVQPLRWMTGAERSDSFVRDDPAPALWECATLGRAVRDKIARNRTHQLSRRATDARNTDRGTVAVLPRP